MAVLDWGRQEIITQLGYIFYLEEPQLSPLKLTVSMPLNAMLCDFLHPLFNVRLIIRFCLKDGTSFEKLRKQSIIGYFQAPDCKAIYSFSSQHYQRNQLKHF